MPKSKIAQKGPKTHLKWPLPGAPDVGVPDVVLRLVPVIQRPVVASVAHGVSDTNTSLVFVKYVCLMFVLLKVFVCICEGIFWH